MSKIGVSVTAAIVVMVMTVSICITANAIAGKLVGVLEAPASTTNITIQELNIRNMDGVELELRGMNSQVNSKLIDLLFLVASR